MERIYNPKKVSAFLVTILAVMLFSSIAFQSANAYTEKDSDLLYSTEKVVLKGMPVKNKDTKKLITEPVKFKYWDATLQEYQGEVTSKDGVLPDVELLKGHHYIFYSNDENYNTYNPNGKGVNIYLVMNKTGSVAVNDRHYPGKTKETIEEFLMTKRSTPEPDPENARRVKVSLPVFYEKDDSDSFDFGNTKIRFTSDTDVVEVPVKFGFVNAKLYEDMNYTVTVVSDDFTLDSFPITVKDHSEDGRDKAAYMHFSCSLVSYIFLKDKTDAHNKDTTMTSLSGNTTVTGTNFMHGNYILRDRVVNMEIPELAGKDYQVIDIDTVNLYRNELSKIAAGDFKVTTAVPAGKTVSKVYYIDHKKALHEVPSKQTGDKVTFDMNSVGVYNNVILYKSQTAPEFEVAINGVAKWKDAHTIEAALDSDDFTIPADGASHVYLMTMDGSERVFLTNEDKLIKDGNKLIVKLKNKNYRDYRKFTEFGLAVGSIESAEGGAMKSATAAHLISDVKFKLKSISYEEPVVKEHNAGKIVANITGENLLFGEKPGENYDNFSIIPEVSIDGKFIGAINGKLKFDVEVIDNEHAKITVSNIPENTTGKDQKWKVIIKRGWAFAQTPETGADDAVTIKTKPGVAPVNEYTVTFNSNGGTHVINQKVKEGEKAKKPLEPTKEDHIFAGWYADSACTVSFNFDNPITANTTAYAKWTPKAVEPTKHTVVFDSNGGSAVASQTVNDGDKANKPANPTKSGYIFVGWYTDKNYGTEFDFTKAVMANTTAYAKWKADASTPSTPTTEYKFTVGKDAVWNGGDLQFKIENADVDKNAAGDKVFDRFLGIEVDGQAVDKANYIAKPGSVVLTLKESYIRSLAAGKHTIKVKFKGKKTAITSFNVRSSKPGAGTVSNPSASANKGGVAKKAEVHRNIVKTGDSSNSFADILALLLSGSALAGISVYRRKRA